jgi:hypothetical protein
MKLFLVGIACLVVSILIVNLFEDILERIKKWINNKK